MLTVLLTYASQAKGAVVVLPVWQKEFNIILTYKAFYFIQIVFKMRHQSSLREYKSASTCSI